MALQIKHQSEQIEKTNSGSAYRETYYGTLAEVNSQVASVPVGTAVSGKGTVKSIRIFSDPGLAVWNAEYIYQIGTGGTSVTRPSDDFGQKSCTMNATTLSLALEVNSNYKAKWNHFLFGAPGQSLPDWWNTATDTTGIDRTKYWWGDSINDAPEKTWTCLKEPTKPGQQTYSVPTCTITERAKYASAAAAGNAVKNKICKTGTPSETFGMTTGNANWLCESATVEWSGKYWVATLTWTLSGGGKPWDPDFYA